MCAFLSAGQCALERECVGAGGRSARVCARAATTAAARTATATARRGTARGHRRARCLVAPVAASAAMVEIASSRSEDTPSGTQELVLSGELKSNAFLRLFEAVEEAIGSSPVRAVLRTNRDAGTLEARFDVDASCETERASKALQDMYASLPALELTPVERNFMEYSGGQIPTQEVMDYDAGYTLFVDNSASATVTTITLGCFHKDAYCAEVRKVIESEGLQLVFASMTRDPDSDVRNDSMHVLNSNGERLDEPMRRRLFRNLYSAMKGLN